MKSHCPPCRELFNARFQLYSPERIRAIRLSLGETKEEFAARFFVSEDAVKNWEQPEGHPKNRELPGPAARLMLAIEAEALAKRTEKNMILKRIIDRHHKSLSTRFESEAWGV
jgi:DNA-binding transcriptional regulator YiaG